MFVFEDMATLTEKFKIRIFVVSLVLVDVVNFKTDGAIIV